MRRGRRPSQSKHFDREKSSDSKSESEGIRLRSNKILNPADSSNQDSSRSHSNQSSKHSSKSKRKLPTTANPKAQQVKAQHQKKRKGILISNQSKATQPGNRTPGKQAKKLKSLTAHGVAKAEHNTKRSSPQSPDAVKYPKRSRKLTVVDAQGSFEEKMTAVSRPIPNSRKDFVSKDSNLASKEEVIIKNKGGIIPNQVIVESAIDNAKSKTSLIGSSLMSIEKRLADRLCGLNFKKFNEVKMNQRQEMTFSAFFEEKDNPRKNHVLEFSQEELEVLSAIMGRNLRNDFLEEYLMNNSQMI